MTMFVKVIMPDRLDAEDLTWLLERCDGIHESNVCECSSCEQYEKLISDLRSIGYEHEVLEEKPVPKPLPFYVRMILSAWLRDQEEEWRQRW